MTKTPRKIAASAPSQEKPPAKPGAKTAPATKKPAAPMAKAAAKRNAKPKPAPRPEPVKTPGSAPQPAKTTSTPAFDTETLRKMEELSVNIAKAAMTAQSALAKTVFAQPEAGAAPADPFQVGPAMTEIMGALATKPDKLVEAQSELLSGYMELWGKMTRRTLGTEAAPAKPADKRFSDPHWQENVM
ncbi:MAG TPA: class I poly(R)-hydroxyalkanoic acid synthase, partial [Asticcacaulis sp.]|nr:class I poly(R)-hydroxyalkanoic acid synthase [Asticcacaulis sp.]